MPMEHGLQQYRRRLLLCDYLIEQSAYQLDALIHTLTYVTSRMKIIVVPGQVFHSLHIVFHGDMSEVSYLFVSRAWVQRIRRMSHQLTKIIVIQYIDKSVNIILNYFLGFAASGISGEERKCICADLQGIIPHSFKTSGRGQMTAYIFNCVIVHYRFATPFFRSSKASLISLGSLSNLA